MNPMVFLNIAWMERYEGLIGDDIEISSGGSYVKEHGYGHEIFNFKNINEKVYGYVQPPGGSLNISRLGASKDDECIENVLAVFTAAHKDGGTYIVGWYKNATFYKDYQNIELPERKFRNEYFGYYAIADADNATLLSLDERRSFPEIPRRKKGGMGQSNVWYADSAEMTNFKREILNNIEKHEKKKSIRNKYTRSHQVDIEKKEKSGINCYQRGH